MKFLARLKKMRQQLLFKLVNLKKCSKAVIEGFEDALNNILRTVRVDWLILFIQNNINQEQGEFGLWSSKGFNLLKSVVSIDDLEGVLNLAADWQKGHDAIYKSMN